MKKKIRMYGKPAKGRWKLITQLPKSCLVIEDFSIFTNTVLAEVIRRTK